MFKKLCAQCHKIYGEGQDVGPDITRNGRGSFEQLLSNVFDPSLVIGSGYQATTVATADGRVLTGLLAEDSPGRVVLKMQGGNLETIARDDVEEIKLSTLSLMPEDLEKQLTEQELARPLRLPRPRPARRPTRPPSRSPARGIDRRSVAAAITFHAGDHRSAMLLPGLALGWGPTLAAVRASATTLSRTLMYSRNRRRPSSVSRQRV